MFDAEQNVVRYCLGYCNPGLCGRGRTRKEQEHGDRQGRSAGQVVDQDRWHRRYHRRHHRRHHWRWL